MINRTSGIAFLATVVLGVSCAGTPMSPTSPSATTGGSTFAGPGGATIKVTPPGLVAPFDSERIESRRPTFVWTNSTGINTSVGFFYELEVVDFSDALLYARTLGESLGSGSHVMEMDLAYDTPYAWRIRAGLGSDRGPWSAWGIFRTTTAPVVVTTPTPTGDGTVGPARTMSFEEVYQTILSIHSGGRFNLGSNSTRDYRVNFIFGAVAAVAYGHPRWNPIGPDSNWCVKDAGQGRPPSDDVVVRCNTREAWDLISGAGGNGYNFHRDYLGILPGVQNVYSPGRGALGFLPN